MKALVTGGAGFVGRHLVERLLAEGHEVNTVDLVSPMLDEVGELGSRIFGCDLRDAHALGESFKGVDTVFHVAAFASPWGSHEKFWSVNVDGTENVINASKRSGVRRLVAVSSTSAVFDGYTPHVMADETLPYPTKFLSPYSSSKSVGERLVLCANSKELETTVLRPHLIWGPRDKTFLARFLAHARAGPIFHIGGGKTMTDTTYVDNLVEGLVLAAASNKSPGNVYFITNGEPVTYGSFMDRILDIFDLPPARGSIPIPLARGLGIACEGIWSALKLKTEPMLTRYKLAEVTREHTYRIDKAKKDLGYEALVDNQEGFLRMVEWVDKVGAENIF